MKGEVYIDLNGELQWPKEDVIARMRRDYSASLLREMSGPRDATVQNESYLKLRFIVPRA